MGPTLQKVLAENVRKVRQETDLRQDEVAARARAAGLAWTSITVATIEAGQRDIAAEELLLLPIVFDRPLDDFITTDSPVVRVSDTAALLTETLRAVVSGKWNTRPPGARRAIPYLSEELDARVVKALKKFRLDENQLTYFLVAEGRRGEAERKAAQTLKVDPADVTACAIALYGRDLTTERDVRAEDALSEDQDRRAIRGHITRKLLDELRQALAHPREVKAVKVPDEVAEGRVGSVYKVLGKEPLDTDPSAVFRVLVKTIAGIDKMAPEDLGKKHTVSIRKVGQKGSQ